MTKSHTLRTHESPLITIPGAIRVEFSCEHIKGYVWSQTPDDNDEVRAAVRLIAEMHAKGTP